MGVCLKEGEKGSRIKSHVFKSCMNPQLRKIKRYEKNFRIKILHDQKLRKSISILVFKLLKYYSLL